MNDSMISNQDREGDEKSEDFKSSYDADSIPEKEGSSDEDDNLS